MSKQSIVSIAMEKKEYMIDGCESAKQGTAAAEGGPFGASIVRGEELVAAVHNTVLLSCNPTCHAEMNAIRAACDKLKTEDLSDCVLYTTCEPCPMCWGACQRAKIPVIFVGVDREIAAQYGFDDRFFYEEMERPHSLRAIDFTEGLLKNDILSSLKNFWSVKRVMDPSSLGSHLKGWALSAELHNSAASSDVEAKNSAKKPQLYSDTQRESFMLAALEQAVHGSNLGKNKNYEVYGTVIVKDGQIVGKGFDHTIATKTAVNSSVVVAITEACKTLGTYILEGCTVFSTVEPDVMSASACYWARVDKIEFAVSAREAAFELGLVEQLVSYVELHNGVAKRQMKHIGHIHEKESEFVFQFWKELQGKIY